MLVHVHSAYLASCMTMSMLRLHVQAAYLCPYPYAMPRCMLHGHVHSAHLAKLHDNVHAACPCPSACPVHVQSMVHVCVHAAFTFIFLQNNDFWEHDFVWFFSSVSSNRIISINFVLFRFREMTVSRNTKFRKMGHLFRVRSKELRFVSISRNENFVGNSTERIAHRLKKTTSFLWVVI